MQGAAFQIGVAPGDVLAGKYRVERILGAGGMGVVVQAHHLQLDERVALKFLLPEALQSAETVARFAREARAAVKIKSEHVARVIDVGQLESGAPYMVMEYLEGGDLAAWLEQHGPMPVETAVDFTLQACEAIAEAHALGIVHRDLKPSNLFWIRRADGSHCVKVLDFGISRMTGAAGSRSEAMTRTNAVVGSPLYMSPEQMQSAKGLDRRTDLWSLGVILYELLTGRLPFEAEAVPELVFKVLTQPPVPPRAIAAALPVALEAVILRCLEKDRERRFGTVAELAVALGPFGPPHAALSVQRAVRIAASAAGAAPQTTGSPSLGSSRPPPAATAANWGQTQIPSTPPRRGSAVAVVGGLAVLSVLAVAGVIATTVWRSPSVTIAPAASVAPGMPAPPPSETLAPSEANLPELAPSPRPAGPPAAIPAVPVRPAPASPSARPSTPVPPSPPPLTPPAAPPPPLPAPPAADPPAHRSCNPPYYYDAKGNKVFKQECL